MKTIQINGVDMSTKEGMMLTIKKFKKHCDAHGYPSKSFKEKVTKLVNDSKEKVYE